MDNITPRKNKWYVLRGQQRHVQYVISINFLIDILQLIVLSTNFVVIKMPFSHFLNVFWFLGIRIFEDVASSQVLTV